MLEAVREHLRAEAADLCRSGFVPGYLASVYHAGEQTVVAEGLANVTTGVPMTQDTGYLMGSITKVLTATLLLQCVERGQIDLFVALIRAIAELTGADPKGEHKASLRVIADHLRASSFLIADGVVIVPQFGDPADEAAIATLRPLFPDRDVRGSPSRNLVWGLGSFHCLSQQEALGTD